MALPANRCAYASLTIGAGSSVVTAGSSSAIRIQKFSLNGLKCLLCKFYLGILFFSLWKSELPHITNKYSSE